MNQYNKTIFAKTLVAALAAGFQAVGGTVSNGAELQRAILAMPEQFHPFNALTVRVDVRFPSTPANPSPMAALAVNLDIIHHRTRCLKDPGDVAGLAYQMAEEWVRELTMSAIQRAAHSAPVTLTYEDLTGRRKG